MEEVKVAQQAAVGVEEAARVRIARIEADAKSQIESAQRAQAGTPSNGLHLSQFAPICLHLPPFASICL